MEMTIDQQRAMAMAAARLRMQQQPSIETAPATPSEVPGPRRSYALSEVPAEAVKNIPASASRLVSGIVQAITSPVQTVSGILDVGAGALRNSLPKSVVSFIDQFDTDPQAAQRASAAASALGGEYKARYGSYDAIKRTVAEDPVGAASDLSTLLTAGGAGATKLGAVKTGAALSKAGAAIDPMRVVAPVIEAPFKAGAKGVRTVYNALDPKSTAYLMATGEKGQEVLNALNTAQEIVPGSKPTAAEAAAGVGATKFAAMGKSAEAKLSDEFFARREAQKAARLNAIGTVAKTPEELAAAEAVREATAKQLYSVAGEAQLPGRERQFKAVESGTTKSGVPRIDPITGQPIMVPVSASDVGKKVSPSIETQTVRVEVGRDSFNQPIYETQQISSKTPGTVSAITSDTLTNQPKLKQDVSSGGQPIYKFVTDGYKYDKELAGLLDRPAVKEAFNSAATIAANKGVSMFTDDGKLTGQGAHLVKLALDDAINPSPATPLAKNTASSLISAKNDYLKWVENKVPAYKAAREKFAEQSGPINRMQVGQFLEGKLTPALGEETAKLRAAGFATAVENAPATIKRATGQSRFEKLSQILTPDEMKVIDDIRSDLARSAQSEFEAKAGRGAAPDLGAMGREVMGEMRAPNVMNVIVSTANDIMRRLQGKLDQKLAIEIATEMLDPELAAKSVQKALDRQARGKKMAAPFKATGRAASEVFRTPAAVNALVTNQENQNALTR